MHHKGDGRNTGTATRPRRPYLRELSIGDRYAAQDIRQSRKLSIGHRYAVIREYYAVILERYAVNFEYYAVILECYSVIQKRYTVVRSLCVIFVR